MSAMLDLSFFTSDLYSTLSLCSPPPLPLQPVKKHLRSIRLELRKLQLGYLLSVNKNRIYNRVQSIRHQQRSQLPLSLHLPHLLLLQLPPATASSS